MKTSLKKLRGALRNERKDHRRPHHKTRTHLGELDQATQDMKDMRGCYDRLLSAAAATANSVYEFSESLGEMGVCLLEKTALSDDEETGKVLLMLGKVQLELQKLVDGYRSHIFQTITVPSESLLNELVIVEEMKRCCDEKRETYDLLRKSREKGKLRGSKGECFSSHQLHEARNEYDEETNAFVFRMKSLRQGQSRNLLTQAARHHAAQLTFFRKALKSLEAIEPHVKLVALEQHIDYNFSELEDDDDDDTEDDDDDGDNYEDADAFESEDESELSFDCGPNAQRPEVRASRTLMEVDNTDVTFPQAVTTGAAKETLERIPSTNPFPFPKGLRGISRSGPLYFDKRFDPAERLAQMRQTPSQKFSSYVLPTPQETKASIPAKADDDVPQARLSSPSNTTSNLWHSSPLQRNKYEKIMANSSEPIRVNTQSVLKESNDNTRPSRLPSPVTEGLSPPRQDPRSISDYKKPKRQAYSGPLTGKPLPHKPLSASGPIAPSGYSQQSSGPPLQNTMPRPASAPKLSSHVSPTFVSSPKISELHELPRPPSHLGRPPHLIARSGPLVSNLAATSKTITASALPVPFKTVPRSYSIPTRSQIEETSHASKPLETPDTSRMAENSSSTSS